MICFLQRKTVTAKRDRLEKAWANKAKSEQVIEQLMEMENELSQIDAELESRKESVVGQSKKQAVVEPLDSDDDSSSEESSKPAPAPAVVSESESEESLKPQSESEASEGKANSRHQHRVLTERWQH